MRDNWDYARDQPLHVTRAERLAREAFDGTLTPPSPRDSAWIEREIGDVPHDRVIGSTCHDNPIAWAQGRDRVGELCRATDGTLGRLGPVSVYGPTMRREGVYPGTVYDPIP